MAKQTVASLSQDVAALQDGLTAIMAHLTQDAGGQDTDDKPKTKASTKAKAKAIRRNLDPVTVDAGGTEFTIAAQSNGGMLYRRGARVMCPAGRSLTGDEVSALTEHSDAILEAVETVNEQALIGDHLPDTETTNA